MSPSSLIRTETYCFAWKRQLIIGTCALPVWLQSICMSCVNKEGFAQRKEMMTQAEHSNAFATCSDGLTPSIAGALINWSHLTGFFRNWLWHIQATIRFNRRIRFSTFTPKINIRTVPKASTKPITKVSIRRKMIEVHVHGAESFLRS